MERSVLQAFAEQGLSPAQRGDVWSLDGIGGMDGWWLGVKRGALVLATRPPLVQDVLDGHGDPWIPVASLSLAKSPGIWVSADLTRWPLGVPIVAQAHMGSPTPGEVLAFLNAPGLMDALDDQLPGLVEDRAPDRFRAIPVPDDKDPVGDPPSTEALSVLMLIASRQEVLLAETGVYAAYSGGPREVDALDDKAVPWDGIEELELGPMDAACRYEIRVDYEGWLATAWCDQDSDGEPAVLLLRPGGTPIKVSPPRVR
jgi:hypothetical protein